MPLYRLTPVDDHGDDPAWDRTAYWGVVFVQAPSEPDARWLADRALRLAPQDERPGPWRIATLVRVCEDADRADPPNAVLVPVECGWPDGPRMRWEAVV